MVLLFLNFEHTYLLQPSIAQWVQGDQMVEQIVQLANQLHQQVNLQANQDTINQLMAQVNQVSLDLTPVEAAFSNSMGDA